MNISEQVIYSTLAQISKHSLKNLSKKKEVVNNEPISIIKSEKKKKSVKFNKKLLNIIFLSFC